MEVLTDDPRPPGDVVGGPGPGAGLSRAARVRVLLAAALGPLVTGYAAVATVLATPSAACVVPGWRPAGASFAGIPGSCGRPGVVADRLAPLAVRGLRAGALGLAVLLACGAAVFPVATAVSWATVSDIYEPA